MKGTTTTTEVPTYRAERAGDGTWTIYNVPLFSEHSEELPSGKVRIFSREWLNAALGKALTRQAEGYYAPAHVRHHSFGKSDVLDAQVEAAGKVRFTEVRELSLGGKPTATIFGDLVGIRPEVYDRIRKGELSYRSVEVLKPSAQEIDSLAFLDHEVPFFRYPLLRVAEELDPAAMTSEGGATALSGAGAARAFYASQDGAVAVLFSYSPREGDVSEPTSSQPATGQANTDEPAARMDGMGGGEILQLLKAIAAKLGVGGAAPAQNPQASMAPMAPPMQRQDAPVEVGSPGANYQASTGGPLAFERPAATGDAPAALVAARRDGETAALRSRLEALESQLAEQQTENRIQSFAANLRERGFTQTMVDAYVTRARKDGEDVGRAYAEGLTANGPAVPPPSWTGDLHSQAADPDEVAHYAAQGPDALARARELAASHKRAGSDLPLSEWLEINMSPAAIAGEE